MLNQSSCRFINSSKKSAFFNMASDKALAMSFEKGNKPILRLYSWQKSFTIGASQKIASYEIYSKKFKKNCAKRMTGGGVLFHGHDISYSLVLPTHYLKELSVKQSYEKICSFLLNFYKKIGLKALYAKDASGIVLSKSDFCQIGYEAYDIIINGKKIGGNAQKRTKNMIFQHGSIPLFKSEKSIEAGESLEDLGVNISYEKSIELLKESFCQTFNASLENSQLNEKELNYLNKLLKDENDSTKQ